MGSQKHATKKITRCLYCLFDKSYEITTEKRNEDSNYTVAHSKEDGGTLEVVWYRGKRAGVVKGPVKSTLFDR